MGARYDSKDFVLFCFVLMSMNLHAVAHTQLEKPKTKPNQKMATTTRKTTTLAISFNCLKTGND